MTIIDVSNGIQIESQRKEDVVLSNVFVLLDPPIFMIKLKVDDKNGKAPNDKQTPTNNTNILLIR